MNGPEGQSPDDAALTFATRMDDVRAILGLLSAATSNDAGDLQRGIAAALRLMDAAETAGFALAVTTTAK
jgi:hypothetical protein